MYRYNGIDRAKNLLENNAKPATVHVHAVKFELLQDLRTQDGVGQSLGRVVVEHLAEEFVQRHLAALLHREPVLATQQFQVHQWRQAEEQVAETAVRVGESARASVFEKRVLESVAKVLNEV